MDTSAWIAVIAAVIALLSGWFTAKAAKAAETQADEARRQTNLQRQIHEESLQPYVWADVYPDTAQGTLLKLTIRNEGPTVATNIHLQFDPPLSKVFGGGKVEKIEESISPGISYLAPRRRYEWFLDVGHEFVARAPTPTIKLSITYDGPYGPCPLTSYYMNLDYIRYSHSNPDGSLHRIAERIKELAAALTKY